jgi:hypothetical protein
VGHCKGGEAFGVQVDGRELWGSLVDLVWREPVLVIAVLGGDPDVEPPAALRGFGWAAEVAAVAGAVAGHGGWAVQVHTIEQFVWVSLPLLKRLVAWVLAVLQLLLLRPMWLWKSVLSSLFWRPATRASKSCW